LRLVADFEQETAAFEAEREQREEDRVDRARAWEDERAVEREKREEDRVERARVRKEERERRLEQITTTRTAVTKKTGTQPKDPQSPVISKIKNSNIPTTTAKVTNSTSTQPKNRQFPVISKSNTNTEKKQQKQATPPKTISNINRLSTEFGMQMITDRFGDGWHKLITIFFSGQQIAVLFGDAVT